MVFNPASMTAMASKMKGADLMKLMMYHMRRLWAGYMISGKSVIGLIIFSPLNSFLMFSFSIPVEKFFHFTYNAEDLRFQNLVKRGAHIEIPRL